MKATKFRFLTDKEKREIFILKSMKRDIVDNFTLSSKELINIERLKKPYLKLGYALQYLLLKNFGRQLNNDIPLEILSYVGEQIKVQDFNLSDYLSNDVTRKRYFGEITDILGFSRFKMDNQIEKIAVNIALKSSSGSELAFSFLNELKKMKIVAPGISTVEDILSKAWTKAEKSIYEKVLIQIKDKKKLEILLENGSELESFFSQLKNTSVVRHVS